MGLKVTPACDRETVVVSTSQLRFISMFLRPLLEQVRAVDCSNQFDGTAVHPHIPVLGFPEHFCDVY